MATIPISIDATTPTASASSSQLVTFTLGALNFGVDVAHVQEVIRYQTMTRVPKAPSVVEGLINLRGQIVTAIDMRARAGLPPRDDARLPMNVVIRADDGVVSLLVDDIGDVVDAAGEWLEPAPPTVTGALRELVTGVYQLRGRLLLKLDVDQALTITAASD